jgi:hypothetical protein
MLFSIGFLSVFLVRWCHRHLPRLAADRLRDARHLLRRRPLPPGALRLGVFGGFSGHLLLVSEDHFGRMLREGSARSASGSCSSDSWVMLTPMYLVGLRGMPRRIAEYAATTGWTFLNRSRDARLVDDLHRRGVMLVNFYVSWRKPGSAAGTRGTRTRSSGRLVAAAAPQLRLDPTDPLRAPGVGREPPRLHDAWPRRDGGAKAEHEVPV